jgi:hypothetical protein
MGLVLSAKVVAFKLVRGARGSVVAKLHAILYTGAGNKVFETRNLADRDESCGQGKASHRHDQFGIAFGNS